MMIILKLLFCGVFLFVVCVIEIKFIEKCFLSYCCLMLILLGCIGVNLSGLLCKFNLVYEIRFCFFVVVVFCGYDVCRIWL